MCSVYVYRLLLIRNSANSFFRGQKQFVQQRVDFKALCGSLESIKAMQTNFRQSTLYWTDMRSKTEVQQPKQNRNQI